MGMNGMKAEGAAIMANMLRSASSITSLEYATAHCLQATD